MAPTVVQCNYEQMEALAKRFQAQAEQTEQVLQQVRGRAEDLRGGGWVGKGSDAFQAELDHVVLPALQHMIEALQEASAVTLEIREIFRQAEEEAARLFRGCGEADVIDRMISGVVDAGNSIVDDMSDLFGGMGDELKDTWHGLKAMVDDPIGAAKGLAYGVTHPDQLWNAFKQPYVEAWNSGHPMRAIGRGTMFVVTSLVSTKGIDKLSKFAKMERAAQISAEASEVASRFGSPLRAAEALGNTVKGSRTETAIGRYIAQESTHQAHNIDRVVLGSGKKNPLTGIESYVNEAKTNGGIYYKTTDDVWAKIRPDGGNSRAWVSNREFLQMQMERGVSRIELTGEKVSDVFSNPHRINSYTAQELRYLQRNAAEYGYRQIGESWVKIGDWRASNVQRVISGSVAPSSVVVERSHQFRGDVEP